MIDGQSMKPLVMDTNPRNLVAAGYDDIADAYLDRFGVSVVRRKWLGRLIESLHSEGSRVLDLGCGAGIPVARELAALGHSVVGVDGSGQQIVRARRNVPTAIFIEADMCEVEFETASFDAVGAFYSITHIPPAEQGALISKIALWLKPGGTLVASFAAGEAGVDRRMAWNDHVLWPQHRGCNLEMSLRCWLERSPLYG
jgi:SAM-dependent methyltransferase